ncbi:MAG: hypothetical protein KY463_05160 [Actinobacteria bacterium]|nr:hypothetical protein [Actinomycetota bacterium]
MLDTFRGLAAVGILLYHCWLVSGEPALGGGPLRDVLSSSVLAVTLFFVLSGLCCFCRSRGATASSARLWFWRFAWQAVVLAVVVRVLGRLALGDVRGQPSESVLLSSFPLHLTRSRSRAAQTPATCATACAARRC